MKFITLLITLLLLFGCKTNNTKLDLSIPNNAKIGIITLIDGDPVHIHTGTTVFNNNKRVIDLDWEYNQFEKYIYDQISGAKNYTVKIIEPTSELIDADSNFLRQLTLSTTYVFNEKYQADFNVIKEKYNIDYLIAIYVNNGAAPDDEDAQEVIHGSGFGVRTECFLGLCIAEALSNAAVVLFELGEPTVFLARGEKDDIYAFALVELDFDKGVENFTVEDYEKVKVTSVGVMKEKMESMLLRSGLRE